MFAARAGARLAIGVDASDIIGPARAVVKLNGLSDIVQLYHSTLEEFVLPAPLDKVRAREA
jgi:23S rRNA G2069 N7-methylase RlmK/C1962 C5-methylase RlmI